MTKACSVDDVQAYRELVLEHGLGFGPFKRGLWQLLCRKLTEGAGAKEPPYSGNLIIATDPRVANIVDAGAFETKQGVLLTLPPELELLELVRDALYIEQFADFYTQRDDPLAKLARELVPEIQEKAATRWLSLGPRSTLCHQGQLVAQAGTWTFSGKPTSTVGAHETHKKIAVRVQLPKRKGVAGPSFVNADMCLECEEGVVDLRLGLAQARPKPTYGKRSHKKHTWRRFKLPVADLSLPDRHFGFVSGRICLGEITVTTRSRKTKELCLETTGVKLEALRVPNYNVPGAGRAKPEPGLAVGPGHVHVWAILQGDSGREIRCVTCDAVIARAAIETASRSAKAANPGAAPWLGEDDQTPEFVSGGEA